MTFDEHILPPVEREAQETAPLRALMVQDSSVEAWRVVCALRRAGVAVEFERVDDGPSMRAALARRAWDVVLSDWALADFSGMAALEAVRASGLDLPFIVVTGALGEEGAAVAMRAGAHDFVQRDRLARLGPAVEREVRVRAGRRCAETALRASDRRYRCIVETTNEGVWAIDAAGVTSFVNARVGALLGREVSEIVGRSPMDFLRDEDRGLFTRNLPDLQQGTTRQLEVPFVRADGATSWVLLESSPMFDEAGRYEGALAILVDISERKRTETALRSTEAQLRHAQKMEAIGRLAGGVAHDFNNLLSVILGMSELMLAGMDPWEPMRGDLEEIRTAGQRAADLTRQLLLFSRQQVIEPRVLNLNDTLGNLDKMLRRLVGEDVEVLARLDPSLGRVRADSGSVEQVVMNLAVNARDAMPTGGTLTIETKNVALDAAFASAHVGVEPGAYVMLDVRDTGVGMDEATQARIFEPFFTTKGLGKGTGLGLSTVFGIVQQCGGSVWVQSAPGRGSSFQVYFPREDACVEPPRTLTPAGPSHGTETVLLVEDEDQVRAIVCNVLKRRGYAVIEARNAGEAMLLSEAHEGPIALLLSDVVMPRMSGPELAKRLGLARPAMRVMFMSGYTNDSEVLRGVMASSVAFLQKPITVEALTRKVREAIDA